ncbi:MAG TPA: hypothetical protein VGG57_10155 [Stellaceae bacterium]
MSLMTQNKWFRRLGFAVIAATVLGAATIPAAPAQARTWISVAGIHFPIGGHRVHHDYWRNGGWFHSREAGWQRVW